MNCIVSIKVAAFEFVMSREDQDADFTHFKDEASRPMVPQTTEWVCKAEDCFPPTWEGVVLPKPENRHIHGSCTNCGTKRPKTHTCHNPDCGYHLDDREGDYCSICGTCIGQRFHNYFHCNYPGCIYTTPPAAPPVAAAAAGAGSSAGPPEVVRTSPPSPPVRPSPPVARAVPPAQPVDPPADRPAGSWACRGCTYINHKPEGLVCEMCHTHRYTPATSE